MNKITCGLTGHRNITNYDDDKLKLLNEKIEFILELLINIYGVRTFLCGMAIGADLILAKRIIKYRNKNNIDIKIYSVIPCENQDLKWNEEQKKEYKEVLKECEASDFEYGKYFNGCMQKRNKYIVDNCDYLFAILDERTKTGGTVQTVNYAIDNNKGIFFINPKTLKIQANSSRNI